MSEGTKGSSGTAARLLHVVTLCGLVDLRVELLLGAGVAVLAALGPLTFTGIPPLLALLHRWARQRSVLVLVWAAAPVFAVVVVRTGVTLATEARRLLTQLRFVVGQHIVVILPARFFSQDFLYEGCARRLSRLSLSPGPLCGPRAALRLQHLQLPDVVDGAAQVVRAMSKSAVGAVLAAVAFGVCLVDTGARLVIPEVVPALCVACCPVKKLTFVSLGTGAGALVVFGAVHVWAVVEGTVSPPHRSAPPLVQKVPMETGERPMLRAFVLNEQRTLLSAELFEICIMLGLLRLNVQHGGGRGRAPGGQRRRGGGGPSGGRGSRR